ncbi:NAD(FAD)-utilizing dehydrogenase [Thioclava sp. SK-1]|uniref:TIGR03862 family flavoprotein n=1 Tax=Thioclava sp. SK-1 TaxID=1889770 RepID=UPI0008253977|nr:TIGR03862 family flavoprotein [Thioclava sp. SK-1]OCX65788.1 NAD(FAD)-utilizing dehydrogenase [Thioclava sp. SK-1]
MTAVVIGGGPAGLMAAQELAQAGYPPIVLEAKPTLARKFLMAGKSGLNLTKAEDPGKFQGAYPQTWLHPLIAGFGPKQMQDFAADLEIETYVGSTGRVFPTGMKASPFLRAWTARLRNMQVDIRTRWRWTGLAANGQWRFDTPDGAQFLTPTTCVLALGGASWPRLGSDGSWAQVLAERGVALSPFRPANMGFYIEWSEHMRPLMGQPVKGTALHTNLGIYRGEYIISDKGLEGGGIYAISAQLRDGSPLWIDLCPDIALPDLTQRLAQKRAKTSLSNHLKRAVKFSPARLALLNEWGRPLPTDPDALALRIKHLPVPLGAPRPLTEAISTAGGIAHKAVSQDLELTALPGVFAAGEMLDWEAPTGGYLLTACFATGRHAGRAAAAYLATHSHKLCPEQKHD